MDGCKNLKRIKKSSGRISNKYCYIHLNKVTIEAFLSNKYTRISRRVRGKETNRPYLYIGLPILSKEAFNIWARNHPVFLHLYKQWVMCDFDRKLTPSVNRINSKKGYMLDNIEWVTTSQNCSMSATTKKLNQRREVYSLLGVNNEKRN